MTLLRGASPGATSNLLCVSYPGCVWGKPTALRTASKSGMLPRSPKCGVPRSAYGRNRPLEVAVPSEKPAGPGYPAGTGSLSSRSSESSGKSVWACQTASDFVGRFSEPLLGPRSSFPRTRPQAHRTDSWVHTMWLHGAAEALSAATCCPVGARSGGTKRIARNQKRDSPGLATNRQQGRRNHALRPTARARAHKRARRRAAKCVSIPYHCMRMTSAKGRDKDRPPQADADKQKRGGP